MTTPPGHFLSGLFRALDSIAAAAYAERDAEFDDDAGQDDGPEIDELG